MSVPDPIRRHRVPVLRHCLPIRHRPLSTGRLGSDHYGDNPVHPLERTVAAINMDALNTVGPMNDITVVGLGNSELDDYLEEVVFGCGPPDTRGSGAEKGLFPSLR